MNTNMILILFPQKNILIRMLKENLFVTGSSGFLGSYLVDALKEKSHNIKTFDLNKNNYHYKNISHTIGNILDYNHLVNAMRGSNYVFHFASLADIDASYKYPDKPLTSIFQIR